MVCAWRGFPTMGLRIALTQNQRLDRVQHPCVFLALFHLFHQSTCSLLSLTRCCVTVVSLVSLEHMSPQPVTHCCLTSVTLVPLRAHVYATRDTLLSYLGLICFTRAHLPATRDTRLFHCYLTCFIRSHVPATRDTLLSPVCLTCVTRTHVTTTRDTRVSHFCLTCHQSTCARNP